MKGKIAIDIVLYYFRGLLIQLFQGMAAAVPYWGETVSIALLSQFDSTIYFIIVKGIF